MCTLCTQMLLAFKVPGYMTDPNTLHISLCLATVAIQLDHAHCCRHEACVASPGGTNECVVVRANIGLNGKPAKSEREGESEWGQSQAVDVQPVGVLASSACCSWRWGAAAQNCHESCHWSFCEVNWRCTAAAPGNGKGIGKRKQTINRHFLSATSAPSGRREAARAAELDDVFIAIAVEGGADGGAAAGAEAEAAGAAWQSTIVPVEPRYQSIN